MGISVDARHAAVRRRGDSMTVEECKSGEEDAGKRHASGPTPEWRPRASCESVTDASTLTSCSASETGSARSERAQELASAAAAGEPREAGAWVALTDLLSDGNNEPSAAAMARAARVRREEPMVRLMAKALWKMAGNRGISARSPLALSDPFYSHNTPAVDFCAYLLSLYGAMNEYDVEVSCPNPLRDQYTLGFRILVCALACVDRLVSTVKGLEVSLLNVHRVLLSGMLCVSKFSEDEPLNNRFWANVGLVALRDLNQCEMAFCQLLDYDFRVSDATFERVVAQLTNM